MIMKLSIYKKINIPVLLVGVVCVIGGVGTLYKGMVWNLALGDEKYILSFVQFSFGIACTVLSTHRLWGKSSKL